MSRCHLDRQRGATIPATTTARMSAAHARNRRRARSAAAPVEQVGGFVAAPRRPARARASVGGDASTTRARKV
jgi:hypothetical protein